MKWLYVLSHLVFIYFFHTCSVLNAQQNTSVVLRPFWEFNNPTSYRFVCVWAAEGENAIGKAKLENRFTFEKFDEQGDTFFIRVVSDSTFCTPSTILRDGEVLMLYASIGIPMEFALLKNGTFLHILDEEKVIEEFKSTMARLTHDPNDRLVRDMVDENRALFFSSLFDLNYSLVFKDLYSVFHTTEPIASDTILPEVLERPRTEVTKTTSTLYESNQFQLSTTTLSRTDSLRHTQGEFTYVTLPMISRGTELRTLGADGILKHVSSEVKHNHQGLDILKGDKKLNSSSPMTQIITYSFSLEE